MAAGFLYNLSVKKFPAVQGEHPFFCYKPLDLNAGS